MKTKRKPAPARPVSNEVFKRAVILEGNVSRASRKLGISPQAGYQRAKRLGMRTAITFVK